MTIKQILFFLGALSMTLTVGVLVLLIINPSSRYEENQPAVPLRLYFDTSISFGDDQEQAFAFVEELKKVWAFPIDLYPFAYEVGSARRLESGSLTALTRYERQTQYQSLNETLRFLSSDEPQIILSDFIFSDFFNAELQSNPHRFFVKFPDPVTPATPSPAFAIFIENNPKDYRPNLDRTRTGSTETSTATYPFKVTLTLFADSLPAQTEIVLRMVSPQRKILHRQQHTFNSRIETITIPIEVPSAPVLTLHAALEVSPEPTENSAKTEKYSDSMNFFALQDKIPVVLFAFRPYKDVGLIKRTLKRYGLFSLEDHTFLRQDDRMMEDLASVYEKAKRGWSSKLAGGVRPLILVLGGADDVLAFFRKKKETFINLPKIVPSTRDRFLLDPATMNLTYNFLNLTGNAAASLELWNAAAPFMFSRSLPQSSQATKRQYFQRNNDGSSFLFKEGHEVYVGMNAFYELNRSLVASANFSEADVFWVRLLEMLSEAEVAKSPALYLHNYFLGAPVEDPFLVRSLAELHTREDGRMVVSPLLQDAGMYPLADRFYHYRVDLREYVPFYEFDETLFSTTDEVLAAVSSIAANYEQNKIVTTRQLRSHALPYFLLLLFFLSYLLMKGLYSRH